VDHNTVVFAPYVKEVEPSFLGPSRNKRNGVGRDQFAGLERCATACKPRVDLAGRPKRATPGLRPDHALDRNEVLVYLDKHVYRDGAATTEGDGTYPADPSLRRLPWSHRLWITPAETTR